MLISAFFFFNDTATTEIYTLSLHDALPIFPGLAGLRAAHDRAGVRPGVREEVGSQRHRPAGIVGQRDRKSTRLNSSHGYISYAVFCLKKKNALALHHHVPSHDAVEAIVVIC